MAGVDIDPAWAFVAWTPLWEGLCAAHDRMLGSDCRLERATLTWRIRAV